MNFDNKFTEDWGNSGTEPSTELKTNGFHTGYKPPAGIFNWFWSKVIKCITELQTKLINLNNNLPTGVEDYATSVGHRYMGEGTSDYNHLGETFNDTYNMQSLKWEPVNVASGAFSHAEGSNTIASGYGSHAENWRTTASGSCSHSGGGQSQALGQYSITHGDNTTANNYQAVFGKYNKVSDGPTDNADISGDLFILGNGIDSYHLSNALRVTAAGKAYGLAAFGGSGADYAEYFEWLDGNTNNEDRRGLFVALDGEKIRLANAEDDYILGVVSATPVIEGDVQSEIWKEMYLKDVFGEKLTEIVDVEETTDEKGNVIPAHTETRWILNPEYDPDKDYMSRENRKEWSPIGILGKLVVVDDGTCKVNGYCKVSDNGTATMGEMGYRVLSRIDDTHIKILYR